MSKPYYIEWLIYDYLGFSEKRYDKLFSLLALIPFRYSIPEDHAREEDGLYLREKYRKATNIEIYGTCNVLEVLVALAVRMDGEWTGDPKNPTPENTFFEFIINLHLDEYNNSLLINDQTYREVINIINRWLDRDFYRNGEGSIFPLKRRTKIRDDQRELSIWRQMMCYIREYHKMIK